MAEDPVDDTAPVVVANEKRRSHLQKNVIDPLNDFFRDATSFVAGCSRPDKDFVKIATAVAVGFAVVGGTGYIVKFVHIPITQILIG